MGVSKDTVPSAGQPSCSTLMGVIVVPVGSGGFGSVGQEGWLDLGVGYCGATGRGGGEHRKNNNIVGYSLRLSCIPKKS